MSVKKLPIFEKPQYHSSAMFIGGFINAFTFVTRNQFMANNQTANFSRLSIFLALNNLTEAYLIFLTVAAYVTGSFVATSVKHLFVKDTYHWKVSIIAFELAAFFFLGFVPLELPFWPDMAVRLFCCFISAIHLSGFRSMEHQALNSTIVTGNLRTVGELFSNALWHRSGEEFKLALKYALVLFFFLLGVFVCIRLSVWFPTRSIWLCAMICLIQLITVLPKKEVVNANA